MKPFSRRALLIMGIAALLAVSVGVLGRVVGRKRLRFPYLTGAIAADHYAKLAAHPGWAARRISVAPGIGLNGLVRRPRAPDAPWVLFYQGNDATLLERGQSFLEKLGADRDWGLAVFAYRGYDSSDGTPHLVELAADAPVMLDELCKSEHVELGRVHVVGFSIGGHFAVRAMAARARSVPPPASLSLLASVDDIVMYRQSVFAKLSPGDDLQTRPLLDAIPAPVLVVQGTADEALAGPEQGRNIAASLGARAQYIELPGLGHLELLANPLPIGKVRDFVAAHVK